MKKIVLLIVSLLMISTCMAMDDENKISKLQAEVTGLIFHRLYSSYADTWSSDLTNVRKLCSISEYGELKHDPNDRLKYELAYSSNRPNPNQHCSVFIDNPYNSLEFDTFYSKIFFDKEGDLDHIDTEITLKGSEQVNNFERKYKFESKIAYDDQTECRKIDNKSDYVTWHCRTKTMSLDSFRDQFHKEDAEFKAKRNKTDQ